MNGRLLLHVGLPKTATTTLQTHYFPRLPAGTFRYLGTLQPRSLHQDPLFLDLRAAVDGDPGADRVRALLEACLAQGTSVVVSEEMFTVSSRESSWRAKLERLADIVAGLEYRVLVTVRPPVSGSFSYYVELEPRFRAARLDYPAAVASDEAMEIFDYRKLASVLDGCFQHDRLYFKRFEEVIAAKMDDVDHLLGLTRSDRSMGEFGATNQKVRAGGMVRTGRVETLADAFRRSALANMMRHSGYARPILASLKRALTPLDKIKLGERAVRLPTESQREQVATLLQPGWEQLLTRMESQCQK